MRITILDGHPRGDSLCAALSEAYATGARSAGHEVRFLRPRELDFDPVLRGGYDNRDPLEADLVEAQKTIEWCEHLVVVHPVWWGQMPAELKGFFDRTFLPGWGFKFHPDKVMWDKLLSGRSARIIQTAAVPTPLMWLWYGNCAAKALKSSTLGFCGFKPVRVTQFGGAAKGFTEAKAKQWLMKCEQLGSRGL